MKTATNLNDAQRRAHQAGRGAPRAVAAASRAFITTTQPITGLGFSFAAAVVTTAFKSARAVEARENR